MDSESVFTLLPSFFGAIFQGTRSKGGNKKFLQDSIVHASELKPWEMKQYLLVTYSTLHAESTYEGASIEQHVEEAFKFISGASVPHGVFSESTDPTTWSETAVKLCEVFYATKGDWFKKNFKLDYTIATQSEIEYEGNLCEAASIRDAYLFRNKQDSSAADLAIEMHDLVEMLMHQSTIQEVSKKGKSCVHDAIKSVINSILRYTECKYMQVNSIFYVILMLLKIAFFDTHYYRLSYKQ